MGDLGATALFYAARPALTLDGAQAGALEQALLQMSIEEDTSGLYRCEATFANWGTHAGSVGFVYFDRQVLDFGRTLSVELGSGDAAGTVFDGRITAIEGRYPQQRPPEILVLAEDRLQDLRMTRRTRSFEDATLDDVIEQIASDHGLRTELDLDSPTYVILAQVNQSDLAFLRERARDVGAELWIEGDTLHAQSRARRDAGEVTLTYGQTLHEMQVTADLAGQRSKLTVGGWDVAAKEAIAAESDASSLSGEIEGTGGSDLLESALGTRNDQIVHLVPQTVDEARAMADAHYRRLARRFVCGNAVAEGNGRIRVGARVVLRGLGDLFDGAYHVTEARHGFDPVHGYRTHFGVERPWLGP